MKMQLLPTVAVLVVLIVNAVTGIDFNFRQVLTSAKDITTGVAKDVNNLLPTSEGLFQASKNLLTGYPLEFVSSSINQICSSALSSNAILPKVTPKIDEMQFQLRTPCNRYSFPMLQANEMWKSPEFKPKQKVVIFVTGWTTNVNDTEGIDVLAQAYHCRGDINFIALDAGSFVDTLYTWSAFNTEAIGEYMAKGLQQLADIVPIENIHLIGHSLGAHIVGSAARFFNELTGKKIPRVTGLDPAKPCFNEGELLSGLLRGYSDFVDVIHTNPGVLGKRDPLGDVDFYPGGLYPVKEGCLQVPCAHERAWRYYAETVYPGNEGNFMSKRCSSLMKLRENKCSGGDVAMGYAVDTTIKGNYFMEVNAEMPFGVNANKESDLKNKQCGICKS